ncbi:LysR family transcriptional regulator [Clostridium sp. AF18-27]|uniref:ModE molybdate transport repressor domain-containing protein n=1 Tax=Enterocloster lavalensis TaxID=460384 RepID=A0A1I0G3N6_9FIRM|nr:MULTISPECIES: LysR family transcriptional regulator [Enterocloster]RHR55188.1 LysR family transcriptional regulator [Clostridium sp. AF18-27]MCB6345683.1 LysR family transcriptional regulator [Enterocloster lavalensis]MDR3758977.1 LysR family transcriptional regulator [Enterocloster sp.]PST31426.1 LysR family transcriptional regulator [Enterocloster lavalensis]SET64651.1 ModE molybdate transport repressor domain-containing protein [Enterocloster lavalensis]
MKIQDMQLFLEIVQCGSISAASRKLYISQPAVSQCLKKLEQELGTPLLIRRSGKTAELTRTGLAFADIAHKIVPIYDGFVNELDITPRSGRHLLKIGVPPRHGYQIMAALMSHGETVLQNIDLDFQEGPADDQERNLINGDIDLAIIRLPLKIKNLDYKIIHRDFLGIWLRKGSPQEDRAVTKPGEPYPFLPLEALRDETLVLPPAGSRIRSAIDSILKESGFVPHIQQNYQYKKSLLLMVEKGLASTISQCPDSDYLADRFFRIEGCSQSYDLALVYLPDTPYKNDIKLLCSVLKPYFDEQMV